MNNIIIERDPKLLALSDLIIGRLRKHYQLQFDTTDESAPAVLNCAYLIGGAPSLFVNFLLDKLERPSTGCYGTCLDLHVYVWRLPPHPQPELSTLEHILLESEHEFEKLESPTKHIASLRLRFDFQHSTPVSHDIRKSYFAPLLEQFPGRFTYPNVADYEIDLKVDEWNPHPSGIEIAWEAEYRFESPVPVDVLAKTVKRVFQTELQFGVMTRLPYQEIENVGCQFALATRFLM